MANINSGDVVRFENGGRLLVGADVVLNIKAGSLKLKVLGRETWIHRDRGVMQAAYVGDDRPAEVEFTLKVTNLHDSDNAIGALCPADANGKKTLVNLTVERYDYRGASTGSKIVLTSCYCPDGYDVSTVEGPDSDEISFKMTCLSPGAWAAMP